MSNDTGIWTGPQMRCLQCGAPSTDPIRTVEHGAVTVHFKCAEGHIWLVKWVEAA